MGPLLHLARKECLLLWRDGQALLLLFLMPAVFILILSLALRGLFAGHGGASLTYGWLDRDRGPESAELALRLAAQPEFRRAAPGGSEPELRALLSRGQAQFLVVVPAGFGRALRGPRPEPLALVAAPNVDGTLLLLFQSVLREAAARVYLKAALEGLERLAPAGLAVPDLDAAERLVAPPSFEGSGPGPGPAPTSTQQNVPAWLVFAMFFIAIPLSNTWVLERSQGTYDRLLSLGLPRWKLLLGKLLPYMAVNLVQAGLMLAVGVWLVPLFGGDALALGHAPWALAVMVLALSFAAVGYALLVANLARSVEQASLIAGVSILLLAVLGGVMVPRFVMPPTLRALGGFSPMAWGLDGFLDVFLGGGGLAQAAPRALLLLGFGGLSLASAALLFGRGRRA